jgi:putative endonuclease
LKPLACRGEDLVSDYLTERGFSILERNFRVRGAEIDIIARKDGLLCFVEVKTRRSLHRGRGVFAVTDGKLGRIAFAARMFLSRGGCRGLRARFDVAEVVWEDRGAHRINYFQNVWQEG